MQIILASTSPRRAEILRSAGIPFTVRPTDVDEAALFGESAEKMVARLAEAKARRAAAIMQSNMREYIVIGADTTVELDGEIFGKPRDASHAHELLLQLRGRAHDVITGIFMLRTPDGESRSAVEKSAVTLASMSDSEIAAYVATGEPMDKAGAYAIQGLAGRFIPRIEGCYFNVVGLPLARVYQFLRELGWHEK